MAQQDTPTKKCVRVPKSCPVETFKVKRSSAIKFAKHDSLILTFNLRSLNSKSRPRRAPRETRATEFNHRQPRRIVSEIMAAWDLLS